MSRDAQQLSYIFQLLRKIEGKNDTTPSIIPCDAVEREQYSRNGSNLNFAYPGRSDSSVVSHRLHNSSISSLHTNVHISDLL